MKTETNAPRALAGLPRGGWFAWGTGFGLFLASLASLPAQVTVDTLGGGPLVLGGPNNGFVDGPTLQESQFNYPIVSALDPAGFLYVADRDNGAVRRLDVPGDRSTTYLTNLALPVGLVFDAATNLYVVNHGDGTVRKFDRFANPSTVYTGFSSPTAIAIDSSTNIYVAELPGTVKRLSPAGTISVLASGFRQPRGIAVVNNGLLAVSELHAVRLINLTNSAVTLLAGAAVPGFTNGVGPNARFNGPEQIAATPSGNLVLADRFNHRVRLVELNGTVSTLYGIDTNLWASDFPGWEDGSATFAEARDPIGVTVDRAGTIYTSEVFYHIIRQVTGAPVGPGPGDGGGGPGDTNIVIIPAPSFGPNSGFFPMGTTITVTSSVPDVFFTTDGTEPTTNSMRVPIVGGIGAIQWNNTLRDLTSLCVRGFDRTNASVTVCGVPATANTLGVSRDVVGGIGATVVVPVTINLRTNDLLRSLQFRVEVTPNPGSPPIDGDRFDAVEINPTNDFIRVATRDPSAGTGVTIFSADPYQFGNVRGLAISFIGTNANLAVSSFAVITMLAIPIPASASEGNSYRLSVLHPTGTSDAQQQEVAISPGPDRTVTVANISYLVGDSSPARWYNAGDFGDNDLRNNDVNNAFLASLGVRSPYSFTDLFNSMDAYPEDIPGDAGGDGQIRFLDWQVILARSLRLDPVNWRRAWAPGGILIPISTTLLNGSPATPAESQTVLPGLVWWRQAQIGALSRDQVPANTEVEVPVYAQTAMGASLSGLQFRAIVSSKGSAPTLEQQLRFVPALGVRFPRQADGLPVNQVGCAWNLGSFSPSLQGSNLLGYLRFRVPGLARAGDWYSISFANADGAPDIRTQYDLETVSAVVWVQAQAPRAGNYLPDEWKAHFFGALDSAQALPDADADGDGVSNWGEYRAGTDPTALGSRLRLLAAEPRWNGSEKTVALRWLTAPGKKYILESTADLGAAAWNVVAADILGTGEIQEYIDAAGTAPARFYRIRLIP